MKKISLTLLSAFFLLAACGTSLADEAAPATPTAIVAEEAAGLEEALQDEVTTITADEAEEVGEEEPGKLGLILIFAGDAAETVVEAIHDKWSELMSDDNEDIADTPAITGEEPVEATNPKE